MASKREPLIWHAYEYAHHDKSSDWYWAVSIIAVSITITSILFGNLLFAIVIALAFGTLLLYANRRPHLLQVKLDERGIQEGRTRYLYSSLESYWVEDRYGETKIIVKSRKKMMPYIIITVDEVHPDDVRDHLKRFLPEVEHTEPLSKKIMEYLGF